MKILITGNQGFIGSHITTALEQQGHTVVACSRRSGCDFSRMTQTADWLPKLESVDAVINSVGIIAENNQQSFDNLHYRAPVALFKACEQADVKRVIQISALGADNGAFTPYQLSKKAADDALRASDLDWFVLQPSLVYGKGGESIKLFGQLASLPIIPLIGDGKYLVQPVHISDVVASVLKALEPDAQSQQTLSLVGTKALPFVEWLQAIRQAKGKPRGITFSAPFKIMLAYSHVARYIMPLINPDALRMLKNGNHDDVKPMQTFLGRMPLSAQQGLQQCFT